MPIDPTPGDVLPALRLPALTRHQFALYCGGSGDHNPLHTDRDHARERCGQPDVIGHGMLAMALAARLLTSLASSAAIRSYEARFTAPTWVGDALTCRATVAACEPGIVRLALRVEADDGRVVMLGSACIERPGLAEDTR